MTRKDKKTYPLYIRKFLNKPKHQQGAFVIAAVEREESHWEDSSGGKRTNLWYYYTLQVADCNRNISLDFQERKEERANNLHKIDLLLDTFTKFRAAMVESYADMDAYEEKNGGE